MKTDTSDIASAKTHADFNTPAFRQQRITALQRELGDAMDILAETATVLTDEGVPGEVDGKALSLPDRVRWLATAKASQAKVRNQEPYSNTSRGMADAHADGMHADLPREGCPECKVQYRR